MNSQHNGLKETQTKEQYWKLGDNREMTSKF